MNTEDKYAYPKERRDELNLLRKVFEEKYIIIQDGKFSHIKWEECCDGVGDYQVDWLSVAENFDPDFDNELMNYAERLNAYLDMYIAGSDSREGEIAKLKGEIAKLKMGGSQSSR